MTIVPLCRFKLTSRRFLSHLLHVRSMMKYDDVVQIPAAVAVLRQLLWVQNLVADVTAESQMAVSILCKMGQIVLEENR